MEVPVVVPVLFVAGIIIYLVWTGGVYLFDKYFNKHQNYLELKKLHQHDVYSTGVDLHFHKEECGCGVGWFVLHGNKDVKKFNAMYEKQIERTD